MITDSLLLLSDAQALTATAYSTNTIDFSNVTPKRDMGAGEPLAVEFTVDVAADATTGDETYQFTLVQSANADLSSHDVLVATDTGLVTRALLTAGFSFKLHVPSGLITKRYFGVRYVLGGTTPTLTVTTTLLPNSMASLAKPATYAKGYTIS